jgi:hypothetical protein
MAIRANDDTLKFVLRKMDAVVEREVGGVVRRVRESIEHWVPVQQADPPMAMYEPVSIGDGLFYRDPADESLYHPWPPKRRTMPLPAEASPPRASPPRASPPRAAAAGGQRRPAYDAPGSSYGNDPSSDGDDRDSDLHRLYRRSTTQRLRRDLDYEKAPGVAEVIMDILDERGVSYPGQKRRHERLGLLYGDDPSSDGDERDSDLYQIYRKSSTQRLLRDLNHGNPPKIAEVIMNILDERGASYPGKERSHQRW